MVFTLRVFRFAAAAEDYTPSFMRVAIFLKLLFNKGQKGLNKNKGSTIFLALFVMGGPKQK